MSAKTFHSPSGREFSEEEMFIILKTSGDIAALEGMNHDEFIRDTLALVDEGWLGVDAARGCMYLSLPEGVGGAR